MIDMQKVTVGQFINYADLLQKLKPGLEEIFGDEPNLSVAQIFTHYPAYVEAIVKFWTGWETVKDKDMDLVLGVFAAIQQFSHLPEPAAVRSFTIDGRRYFAPADIKVLQQTLPMGKATFGQVLEALQIEQLIKGDYRAIPYVLATLFLRRGETTTDFDLHERAELMRQLPLTEALNAYFFLSNAANNWLGRISPFLQGAAAQPPPKPASAA